MPESLAFQLVDLHDDGYEMRVRWHRPPGAHARPIDAATMERIGQLVTALIDAEQHAGVARDATGSSTAVPAAPRLAAAQEALGTTLYELLDGPDHALAQRLDDARRACSPLHLVVRLRGDDR